MRRGFTIIELLVAIGISVILAAAAAPLYGGLQVTAQLNDNTSLIVQTLRLARTRSVDGYNNSRHGVYFDNNFGAISSYTLYQGDSYTTRQSSYDRRISLDRALIASSTSFILTNGTDIDVNFSRSTGVPNNIGTVRLIHSVSGARNILINTVGLVEEE